VSVEVFTRTSFSVIELISADGALAVDAWLYFPGFKVGNIFLYILLF
jgi:hypothetical protein